MSRVVTSGERGGGARPFFFFLARAVAVRTQNPNH